MTDSAPTAPPKAKQSSGRRRPGPNAAKTIGRNKNYASENDAAGVDPNFRPDFAGNGGKHGGGGAPSTPRRKGQKNTGAAAQVKSPAAPNQQPTSGKSNRRNKNGSKNAAGSNAASKQQDGHRTPPGKGTMPISLQAEGGGGQDSLILTSAPSAAPPTQVFAGNSFHASPAPSALPRPSFMQKASTAAAPASPESPRTQSSSGPSLVQQPSPPASDSELPSATATTSGKHFATGQTPTTKPDVEARTDASPLDVLFRADRAEKAKRRASAANIYNGVSQQHPFASPRVDAVPDTASNYTFPRDVSQQQQHPNHARRGASNQRASSSGISAAELDGNPGQPIGPAFATPFQERMRAAKPAEYRGPPSSLTGGSGGFTGGFTGLRNAASGPQAFPPPTGPQGNYMLTPPLAVPLSPRGPSKDAGSALEASLKRMLFSQPAAPSGPSPQSMPTPPRQQAPHAFSGYSTGVPFPGAYRLAEGAIAQNGSPALNFQGPPHTQGQGQPFGHFDPRVHGAPLTYTGVAPGADLGNQNGSSKIALENSLRQILKIDSGNN